MDTLIIIINQSATCFGPTGSLLLNKNIYATMQRRAISSTLQSTTCAFLHVRYCVFRHVRLQPIFVQPPWRSHVRYV